jgi:hypothetical protein
MGICDTIFVTPVCLGTGQSLGELAAKKHLETFGLIKSPKFTPSVSKRSDDAQSESLLSPASSSPSHPKSLADPKSLSLAEKKLLRNPLSYAKSQSTPLQIPKDLSIFDSNNVLLAGFAVEYKKWNDDEAKALNQERMYLVALVTFLATVGIRGFPVFGLMTSGHTGGIMMAWMSDIEKVCGLVTSSHAITFLPLFLENIHHRAQHSHIQFVKSD